jgi:IclR family transcriptional regulator, acetate operon repressor
MAVKTIRAVDNALQVIEQLARAQPVGVSALARATGLDKMAVQRVLVTLHERGWIHQVVPNGPWELTASAVLGDRSRRSLRERARPHLDALAARSAETVLLFERHGERLVVVDGVDSPHLIRMTVPVGTEVALTRNGALDAFLDAAEREALEPGVRPVTARGIATTRARGYFVIDGMYPHAVAVGAPLFGGDGQVAGSVLVVGPRERVPRRAYPQLGALVLAAATAITGGA